VGASAWLLAAAACGQENPRILESKEAVRGGVSPRVDDDAEPAKIRALIKLVRESEHTFVMAGIERSGSAAADRLKLELDRDVAGVRSAREFIDRIAAPEREGAAADRVTVGPEEVVPAHQWFVARLSELEGRPIAPPHPAEEDDDPGRAPATQGNLRILDALLLVERSGLKFVAPPRKPMAKPVATPEDPSAVGKRKPKRKEYTSREFADMLRKKWEFLGADIDDFETFMDEIGSDSFATMEPYLVIREDGTEEQFRDWLEAELAKRRQATAAGGAP
jgi:hypothetical protein